MHFKTSIWLLVVILPWVGNLPAQSGKMVRFTENLKDFGTVREVDGVVSHRFDFYNETGDAVTIEKVEASCGCTSPEWTSEPVAPEDQGYVKVVFNPHNRPGPFDKSLEVSFINNDQKIQLRIRGFVVPPPATLEEEFPVVIGNFRIKNKHLSLGNIPAKRMFSKSFDIYNQGSSSLFFKDEIIGGDHITITFEPFILPPKSRGKLWVHYDVQAKGDLGYFREDIAIFTDEPSQARKDLAVTTTIIDLPVAQRDSGPRIAVAEAVKDFGIKQQGDTVSTIYQIQNLGKEELIITKAFTSCNCMRVQVDDQHITPGNTGQVRVTFLTHQRVGNQEKLVTVFTNDPAQPVTILSLKGLLRGPRD